MRINRTILLFFFLVQLSCIGFDTNAQSLELDTISIKEEQSSTQEYFYDSLKYKAGQKKLTQIIYDFLISPPRPYVDKKALALNYYSQLEGKIISEIEIKSLDVFGPSFQDTTKKASSWIEKASNSIHTKSNLKTIQKLLLFRVGDNVDPEVIYENERIIRTLPYIKDIQILLNQDTLYTGLVKVTVLIKDRFSFGASGDVNGTSSAALKVFNQNTFGVGHEISFRFLGHLTKQPYLGVETFYKIKNIRGKFIDISTGYTNTYRNEGFTLLLNKPFISPSVKWGYGANAIRMYRTDRIFDTDPIKTLEPMDLSFYSAWAGRSFQIKPLNPNPTQLVLSAGFYNRNYFTRPKAAPDTNQYFSNSTFYLTGITFTQRRFVHDQLIYSYGITEDIPEGFKNEIVYGFDANEFGNRHYAHIYLSNGNLLINKKGYLFLAGGVGGYFTRNGYQQGQVQAQINFISKQIHAGRKRFRLFSHADYTLGLQRFDIENLALSRNSHIRGFSSKEVVGKQRLSLNLEYVLFLRRELYSFNMAIFGFTDIGIIGDNDQFFLTTNYYSGIGMGVRIHNENLVFKTFHLRLAFYPFHPGDINFVGFILDEQSKKQFYSFEPTAPLPFLFE